ncbi:MAG: rhomboid family intramembrane serine protease [Bacteroidetes bacterium]|nr:rhomboid family intramembrane serine protease [Bacteroidota bacterium]MBU1720283.1 rhomboid family intramembrane serine protease [Bacteroidota bacterium]
MVLESRSGIDLIDILGLHYFSAESFKPYQLITYMFMHGGFSHILFNMFAVWMFGSAIENIWGPKRFLIFYLITGLGAALTHYIVMYFDIQPVLAIVDQLLAQPDPVTLQAFLGSPDFVIPSYEVQELANAFVKNYNTLLQAGDTAGALQLSVDFMTQYREAFLNAPVIVGASGAVFGILLAFGMTFPESKIYIYFLFPIKAKYFVIIYGAIELFAGISETPGDNVAHFAHLGGMVFGLLLILLWRKKRL